MAIYHVDKFPPYQADGIYGVDIENATRKVNGKITSSPYIDPITVVAVSDGVDTWYLRNNYVSLIPFLIDPKVKKVIHNAAHDLAFLQYNLKIEVQNVADTLLAERILTAGTKQGNENDLASVLARRVGVWADKSLQLSFVDDTPLTPEQELYVANDVMYLPEIRKQQIKELAEAGLGKIIALEHRVLPVTIDMILTGVGFDRDLWNSHELWIRQHLIEMARDIADTYIIDYTTRTWYRDTAGDEWQIEGEIPRLAAGKVEFDELWTLLDKLNLTEYEEIHLDLNFNSVPQMKVMLKNLDIRVDNTQEATLVAWLEEHPEDVFISTLLEWRGWVKLLGWKYDERVSPVTGRIHPSWNQIGADSGRMSCKEPNLQQVPRPTEGQPNFRSLFMAKPNHKLIVADYQAQEMRILAQISKDEVLLKIFEDDQDIHSGSAAMMYNTPLEEVTKIQRYNAKTLSFGLMYGMGALRLSASLGITLEEGEALMRAYLSRFKGVNQYIQDTKQQVHRAGYVTTIAGRRRYFPQLQYKEISNKMRGMAEREAINMRIQGTAVDITKLAAANLYKSLQEYNAHIILMVHDEVVVEVPEEHAEIVFCQVVEIMEAAMQIICPDVPVKVEGVITPVWTK